MNQRFTECTELTVILHLVIFQIMVSKPGYVLTVTLMCVHNKTMTMWTSTKNRMHRTIFWEEKREKQEHSYLWTIQRQQKQKKLCCGSSDNFTCVHNEAQVCWLHFFTLQAFCVFLPLTQFSHHPFACCIPILCLIDLLVVCSYVPCIVSSKLVCVLTQQIYSLILLPLW